MSATITLQEAAEFLWREAEMLDKRDYQSWLDIWADDGLYIIPIDVDAKDYADVLNYIYDDAEMRKMRCIRLQSRYSMAAVTASTTVRTVSRFVMSKEKTDAPNEVTIHAAQHVADYRRDTMRLLAGNVEVTLRQTDQGLKLVKKILRLANCEDAVSGIAFLL